jgi:hypothetical protein
MVKHRDDDAADSAQLLGECASGSAPAAYAEAPALAFNAGVRVKRDTAWAYAFCATYGVTLLLGAIAASKANPAYAVLTTESALNVRGAPRACARIPRSVPTRALRALSQSRPRRPARARLYRVLRGVRARGRRGRRPRAASGPAQRAQRARARVRVQLF